MGEEEVEIYEKPVLSKEQKTGFVLLVIFAILAVGLGVLQIRNGLYAPFALSNKVPLTLKNDLNGPDSLRFRDTDHDELSDFDELYVYGTSPYLYDTFSYGISDKEVVGKNLPLCPKGQCADPLADASTSTVAEDSAGSPSTIVVPTGVGEDPGTPQNLDQILNDPVQLRKMLAESGVSQEVLKKLSDSELLKMVTEILSTPSSSTTSVVGPIKQP